MNSTKASTSLLGKLPFGTRHPICRHGPINGHTGFVHGYLGESFVVASHFQGYESAVAVTDEQGRAGRGLYGKHILTLFDDAVVMTLRAALASSTALDGVDRKTLSQRAGEGGVIGCHGEDAGNNKNRWPTTCGDS